MKNQTGETTSFSGIIKKVINQKCVDRVVFYCALMMGIAFAWFVYSIWQLPIFGGNYDPIDIYNSAFSNVPVMILTGIIIHARKTNNLIRFDKFLHIFLTFVVMWGLYQLSLDLYHFKSYSHEWIVICGISTNLLYFVGGIWIWSTLSRMVFLVEDEEVQVKMKDRSSL